jgi:hypothetical protein
VIAIKNTYRFGNYGPAALPDYILVAGNVNHFFARSIAK